MVKKGYNLPVLCRVSLGTLIFILLDIGPIWIMELDKADRASGRISKTSNGGGSNTTSQVILKYNSLTKSPLHY